MYQLHQLLMEVIVAILTSTALRKLFHLSQKRHMEKGEIKKLYLFMVKRRDEASTVLPIRG